MITRIWINGMYRNLTPDATVNTFRAVTSFCVENCLPDRLVKLQGGYYRLNDAGNYEFKFKTLNEITFKELYNILS